MSTAYSNAHDLRVKTRAQMVVLPQFIDRQPTRTNQLCGICGCVNETKEETRIDKWVNAGDDDKYSE